MEQNHAIPSTTSAFGAFFECVLRVVRENGDTEGTLALFISAWGGSYKDPDKSTPADFTHFSDTVYASLMGFRSNGGHYASLVLHQAAMGPETVSEAATASTWLGVVRRVLFEEGDTLNAPGAPGWDVHLTHVKTPTTEQFVRGPAKPQELKRLPSKYPGWSRGLDERARQVLGRVGVAVGESEKCKDIIVMPDAGAIKNAAIAVMMDSTAENVRKSILEVYRPRYSVDHSSNINYLGWCDRVKPGVILLTESCLDSADDIGILLHEAGHVVSEKHTECGAVFTLELKYITELMGAAYARKWFTTKRGAQYLRDYPFKYGPGCAEFAEALRGIHDEAQFYWEFKADHERVTKNDLPLTQGIREKLGIPEGQTRPPVVGDIIKGNIQLLRSYATTILKSNNGSIAPPGPKRIGQHVKLGGLDWRVRDMPESGTFVLERIAPPEE
ncbi:hypothetical protein ACTVZO_00585 [Streptomyces sp. IBSNAI002]|uniref:hypothetical protein n=1 Tax=Streptomyces sp. IBSNAI002 TaxID=3457500 RepID=UPI003FD4C7F0